MSTTNEDGKQPEKMESVKEGTACCGPGCGCESAGKPSKGRWVVGVIVLAAAGVMVVRGMVRSDKGSTQASAAGFADPAATETAGTRLGDEFRLGRERDDRGSDHWRVCRVEHRGDQDGRRFHLFAGEGRDGGQGSFDADESGGADDRGERDQVRSLYPEDRFARITTRLRSRCLCRACWRWSRGVG